MEGKILIVDDEESVRTMLSVVLQSEGYEVFEASNGQEALTLSRQEQPDVIVMDVRMPIMDGMAAFRAIRHEQINSAIILMTAFAAVDTAVEAMKAGAYDYIIKPFNIDEVKILLRRAVENKHLANEANLLRKELSAQYGLSALLTRSPRMRKIYDTVLRVASTQTTVLITGESGTGKELLMNAIHYNSQRADGPLIKVNCSAIPETLYESELFGHEKGAFTSAASRRVGRFELANKGTLFLDEIGEMPLPVQAKLLRVLQEKEFERVGGSQTIKTDMRLIVATNRNLPDMVARGEFREDLYYRLAVVTIEMPPLRDRKEDLPLLARLLLQKFAQETGREIDDFEPETMIMLERYAFPGNIRELSNILEHAVVMSTGRMIFPEDLPQYLIDSQSDQSSLLRTDPAHWQGQSLREIIKEKESEVLGEVLRKNKGNRMKTARDLGMSRRALHYKIEEYGLAAENEE